MNGESMNEGPDTRSEDVEFDKYLAGQSELSQQYHATIDDEPATSIDAAVRFRAAAQAQRLRLRRYARWTVPVALAASVVFAVTALLQAPATQMKQYQPVPIMEEMRQVSPATTPPSEVIVDISKHPVDVPSLDVAIESSAPAMRQRRAERSDKAAQAPVDEARIASSSANAESERDAFAAAPPSAPPPMSEPSQSMAAQDSAAVPMAQAPLAATQAEKSKAEATMGMMEKRAALAQGVATNAVKSPEDWLQEIVLLRKQGKVVEAEAQMKEFRAHYPDYQIPASAKAPVDAAPAAEPPPK